MYERWWRVEATGVENVPAHGRAMLVANHAGVLPWDATMMSVAILKQHPLPRYPRFMVLDWAFRLPWVSSFMRRVGGVVASPFNAMRLLEQDHLVMVFPEGIEGRGQAVLRALPAAAVRARRVRRGGSADRRADRAGRGRRVGGDLSEDRASRGAGATDRALPTSRSRRTFPALGPPGTIPLPSKWRIEFCAPIDLSELRSGGRRRPRARVRAVRARPRTRSRTSCYENLVKRGSAFL